MIRGSNGVWGEGGWLSSTVASSYVAEFRFVEFSIITEIPTKYAKKVGVE